MATIHQQTMELLDCMVDCEECDRGCFFTCLCHICQDGIARCDDCAVEHRLGHVQNYREAFKVSRATLSD